MLWKAPRPSRPPPVGNAPVPPPTRATEEPDFVACSSLLFLQFADGAADGFEVWNPHLLVFAGNHDPLGTGLECLDHTLIDLIRIGIEVPVSPRHVKPHARIDIGLSFRRRHAAPGFTEDVIRRKSLGRKLVQFRFHVLVITEQIVIQLERLLERKLAENRLLETIQVPEPDPRPENIVIAAELDRSE